MAAGGCLPLRRGRLPRVQVAVRAARRRVPDARARSSRAPDSGLRRLVRRVPTRGHRATAATRDLAGCARRFDVSPAWQAFVGAEPALGCSPMLDPAIVRRHHRTRRAFRDRIGLTQPARPSAIVTWRDPSRETTSHDSPQPGSPPPGGPDARASASTSSTTRETSNSRQRARPLRAARRAPRGTDNIQQIVAGFRHGCRRVGDRSRRGRRCHRARLIRATHQAPQSLRVRSPEAAHSAGSVPGSMRCGAPLPRRRTRRGKLRSKCPLPRRRPATRAASTTVRS